MTRLLPTYTPPGAVPAAGAAAVAAPAVVAPAARAAVRPAPPAAASRIRLRHRLRGRWLFVADAIIASPSHPWRRPRRLLAGPDSPPGGRPGKGSPPHMG